jgi:hypothetical protein
VPKLGLIAGNGVFPVQAARAARARGIAVVAIAHLNESMPQIAEVVDTIEWIKIGELEKIIAAFKRAGVTEAAMAGGISRARLADSFAPDARALKMLAGLGRFSDDAVLRGVAREVESEGITMIDPVATLMPDAIADAGLLAGPVVSAQGMRDLDLAFQVARSLGSFDIGQTVAVADGVVLAVEAVEGTNATLRRARSVAHAAFVVAKAAKPGQDLRFDRPAIGPDTIDLLAELNASALGIEAGMTLILDRAATLERAEAAKISVIGHA